MDRKLTVHKLVDLNTLTRIVQRRLTYDGLMQFTVMGLWGVSGLFIVLMAAKIAFGQVPLALIVASVVVPLVVVGYLSWKNRPSRSDAADWADGYFKTQELFRACVDTERNKNTGAVAGLLANRANAKAKDVLQEVPRLVRVPVTTLVFQAVLMIAAGFILLEPGLQLGNGVDDDQSSIVELTPTGNPAVPKARSSALEEVLNAMPTLEADAHDEVKNEGVLEQDGRAIVEDSVATASKEDPDNEPVMIPSSEGLGSSDGVMEARDLPSTGSGSQPSGGVGAGTSQAANSDLGEARTDEALMGTASQDEIAIEAGRADDAGTTLTQDATIETTVEADTGSLDAVVVSKVQLDRRIMELDPAARKHVANYLEKVRKLE